MAGLLRALAFLGATAATALAVLHAEGETPIEVLAPASRQPTRLVTGPASPTVPPTTAAPVTAPVTTVAAYRHLVAVALGPTIDVFDSPGQPVPAWTLPNPRPSGAEQVFLILHEQPEWIEVMVPVRPNGSTGWVRASDVRIQGHDYRIVVELGAHLVTVYRGDEVFHQEPVGVGRDATPTPGGRFFTVELFRSLQPAYGPYAYGLSGYSEVLYDFAGGDGQFGIHGTNNPSGLGSDVSNGCIRMSNEGITRLAETLPIGVPVEILP